MQVVVAAHAMQVVGALTAAEELAVSEPRGRAEGRSRVGGRRSALVIRLVSEGEG